MACNVLAAFHFLWIISLCQSLHLTQYPPSLPLCRFLAGAGLDRSPLVDLAFGHLCWIWPGAVLERQRQRQRLERAAVIGYIPQILTKFAWIPGYSDLEIPPARS
jgi:hypothetical protein